MTELGPGVILLFEPATRFMYNIRHEKTIRNDIGTSICHGGVWRAQSDVRTGT